MTTSDKIYLIPEYKLRELLQDSNKLTALECGGVDNWSWYSDSIGEFVKDFVDTNRDYVKEYSGEDIEDFYIDDIAEFDLLNFSTVADLYDKVNELMETLS